MKRFLSAAIICIMVASFPVEVFASNAAERIAERVTGNVLSNVITDSIREQHQEAKAKRRQSEAQAEAESKIVTELSLTQYNDFLEFCVSGDLGGFQKKFVNENISSKAYLKGTPEKTLVKLAASSPNSAIIEFLFSQAGN